MSESERLGDANGCPIRFERAILRDKPGSQGDMGEVRDRAATEATATEGWMRDDGNVSDAAAPNLVTRQRDKLAANKDSR